MGRVKGPLSGGTPRQVQCFFYGRGAGQPEEPFDEIMEVLSLWAGCRALLLRNGLGIPCGFPVGGTSGLSNPFCAFSPWAGHPGIEAVILWRWLSFFVGREGKSCWEKVF